MDIELEKLFQKHKQIINSHICDVNEEDYLAFEEKKNLLMKISEVENSTLTICDMNKGNYLLKCSRFNKQVENGTQTEIEDEKMEAFYKIIHPDDLPFVLETEIETYAFLRRLPPSEKKDYKLVYDFRIRNSAMAYSRLIYQMVILELDKRGNSWLVLVVTDLLSEKDINHPPRRKMINMKTGKLFLFDDDGIKSDRLLSKRETEVLKLIAQGLDSQDISERLFISINTVNNHRQNILSKTKTENSIQALLYAKKIGLI